MALGRFFSEGGRFASDGPSGGEADGKDVDVRSRVGENEEKDPGRERFS